MTGPPADEASASTSRSRSAPVTPVGSSAETVLRSFSAMSSTSATSRSLRALRFDTASTIRASFALYNTRAEVDALVAALAKARDILG